MVNHCKASSPTSRLKRATLSFHHPHTPCILQRHSKAISGTLRAEGDMATKKQITVVGSINVDLVFTLQRLPAPGETVSAFSLERFPGGKVLSQAAFPRLHTHTHTRCHPAGRTFSPQHEGPPPIQLTQQDPEHNLTHCNSLSHSTCLYSLLESHLFN
jgi:hypothetical protein